jgi:ABC-2 type transport system ATP-binding protein
MNNEPGTRCIIRVTGLAKSFGDVRAVDGIDFSVRRGECFGLVGPNGAGKTTTIKILITLLSADSGEAVVDGHSVRNEPRMVRRSIGYVPQSVSVDGLLTGYENMEFHGLFQGMNRKEIARRIPEILSMFDLEKAAGRRVATYSGGMIRRLEIGLSVLHRPRVVFLDEPTVGLDAVSRKALWRHIKELRRKEGVTVFMTTHYLEEAESLCARIAIMNSGRITAMGTMAGLRKQTAMSGASLEKMFIRLAGRIEPEKGDLMTVKRSRRLAQRLG